MTAITVIDRAVIARINQHHSACQASYGSALGHAIDCGRELAEVKAELAHGEWLPWLAEHTEIEERVAQMYMRLATHEQQLRRSNPNGVSDLSIGAALKQVSAPKPKRASASDASAMLQGLAGGQIAGQTERPRAVSPLNLAWSSQQERKRAKARDLLNDAHAKMDDASLPGLSAFSRAATLREAAIKARQAASELDALAFSFES